MATKKNNIKYIFEKQGGIQLLKQYAKSGVLFTAISQFLLLGRSRTALEILRLSTQMKVKNKLEKKYKKTLINFDENYDDTLPHESSNKVWVCWLQGMDNAPMIVKKCYESLKQNMPDRDIILITSKNISDYVQFPDYITDKWKTGQISNTHLTDLLRLELLIQYGGMWVDATVFCSDSNIPDYIFNSNLFMYQCLKPGRDGHSHLISSWLISAKTNNKILMATRKLCYEYWKTHNDLMDYYLLHDFMSIVLEFYPDEWGKIIPADNASSHELLLRLFDNYDRDLWHAIKEYTPFHKLTYKFSKEEEKLKDTFYSQLIKNEI